MGKRPSQYWLSFALFAATAACSSDDENLGEKREGDSAPDDRVDNQVDSRAGDEGPGDSETDRSDDDDDDDDDGGSKREDGGSNGRCGDGQVQAGEECDDGSANGEGGSDCTKECDLDWCGNGHVGAGEACDDGNDVDCDDGCNNDCIIPSCGDGVVQCGEECDDGNQTDGDSCDKNCNQEALGPLPESFGPPCSFDMPYGVWLDNSTPFLSSCASASDPVSLSQAECAGIRHVGVHACTSDSAEYIWLRWTESGTLLGEVRLGDKLWTARPVADVPSALDWDAGQSVNIEIDIELAAEGESPIQRTLQLMACVMPLSECPE